MEAEESDPHVVIIYKAPSEEDTTLSDTALTLGAGNVFEPGSALGKVSSAHNSPFISLER